MQLRRLAAVAAGLTFLVTFGVACSGTGNAVELEVGDCFQDPDNLDEVVDVETVDCDEDHDNEVFLVDEQDDGDYPGESDLSDTATDLCQGGEFEDYVGTSFQETSIFAGFLVPTEELWDQGHRNIVCFAFLNGEQLDQSVEGAGEDFPLEGFDDSGDGSSDDSGDGSGDDSEDTSLEDFADDVEACEDGDMEVCDQLFLETPAGSEAETVGATCGGRSDTEIPTQCESEFG